MSPRLATTRGSARAASRTASNPIASPTGVAGRVTVGPSPCASASTPPYSVGPGGRPNVRSGSTIAACARFAGSARPTLRPTWPSCITHPPVTSEPVPAVVGIATSGMAAIDCREGSGAVPSTSLRIVRPQAATNRAPLAVSSAEPPPMATTPRAPSPASVSPASWTLSIVGSPGSISITPMAETAPSTAATGPEAAGSTIAATRVAPSSSSTRPSSATVPTPKRILTGK